MFYRSVYANPAALDRAPSVPGRAKLAAALSLLLWTSIACCGRGIGYIEPPLDKIHAQLQLQIFVKDAALVAPPDSSAAKRTGPLTCCFSNPTP